MTTGPARSVQDLHLQCRCTAAHYRNVGQRTSSQKPTRSSRPDPRMFFVPVPATDRKPYSPSGYPAISPATHVPCQPSSKGSPSFASRSTPKTSSMCPLSSSSKPLLGISKRFRQRHPEYVLSKTPCQFSLRERNSVSSLFHLFAQLVDTCKSPPPPQTKNRPPSSHSVESRSHT